MKTTTTTVVLIVVISGPLQIKFKIGLVEGHPLFFEHRFSRCESYTCREYKHIVFYNFLQKKYIVVQQVVQYTPVVTIWNSTYVFIFSFELRRFSSFFLSSRLRMYILPD